MPDDMLGTLEGSKLTNTQDPDGYGKENRDHEPGPPGQARVRVGVIVLRAFSAFMSDLRTEVALVKDQGQER